MEEEEQVGNPNTTTVAIAGLSIETAATSIQAPSSTDNQTPFKQIPFSVDDLPFSGNPLLTGRPSVNYISFGSCDSNFCPS
uniref:Uncharacterized protein n=1 Tax=Cucumis sativus TaxID=3659 RepID=A0A0A0KMS9_CUCSA